MSAVARISCVGVWVLLIGGICALAQQAKDGGEPFVGTWTGTWAGAGSGGGFELTLEKNKDAAVTGRVSVTGEPTYKAAFKSLAFDGKKMTAKYDFPPDDAAEVVLMATFDGNTAKGTWSLREKANDTEAFSGTWTVDRK
jgi:hypothetical protein